MAEAVGEQIGWLLDFLRALDAQRRPPVLDINTPGLATLRASDLPDAPGVQLSPGAESWLTVEFVDLPPAPEVPVALVPLVGQRHQLTPFTPPSVVPPDPAERGTDADAPEVERYEQANRWVASVWAPWAEQHRRSAACKQLHRRLFEMRELLIHDRGAVEIVWGFGRVLWRPQPGVLVDHPLLTVPVEITVDPVDQRIAVSPSGPAAVESNYVANLTLDDFPAFSATRTSVDALPDGIEPWDESARFELVRTLARAIDQDGTTAREGACPAPASEVLQSDLSWVLYLRRPNPDYQGYLDAMRELNRSGVGLSAPFRAVVAEGQSRPAGAATEDGSTGSADERATTAQTEQLLLPLPANEEQLRILERASQRTGVTVKGPPGTGKSHTIANIVSHYVAHGKRVLVVAEKEQPLEVLRDKVPADIRDLTVAVLGSDAASRQQLEASINGIQRRVSTLDRAETDAAIVRLTDQLRTVDRRTAQLTSALLAARATEAERRTLKISGEQLTPSEAARFRTANAGALGYIPDELSMSVVPPLAPSELAEMAELHRSMGLARARACLDDLPDPSELPTGADLARTFALFDGHEDEVDQAKPELHDLARVDATTPETLGGILTDLRTEHGWAVHCAGTWLARVDEQTGDPLLAAGWAEFVGAASGEREQVLSLASELMKHDVTVPDNPPPAAVDILRRAQATLAVKGKLGVFAGEAKDALRGCSVDGRTPSTADEVGLCLDAIRRNQLRRQLVTHWANQMSRIGGPPLPDVNPEDHAGAGLDELARVLGGRARIEALGRRLAEAGILAPARPTAEQFARLDEVTTVAAQRATVRAEGARHSMLARALDSGAMRTGAAPLWAELGRALAGRQTQAWDEQRQEVIHRREAAPRAQRLVDLHRRLSTVAPRWATEIAEDAARVRDPENLMPAWKWRQLDSWVTQLGRDADPAMLQRELEDLGVARRRLVTQLVTERAWRRMADAIGERERQALNRYLIAVKQFGKTGGKYAPRKLQEIRAALRDSSTCIPVWIMTAGRALASFRPAATPPFDVLIIDEASQIGLDGVPLFALANSAIVVGDEKQTSPENVGVDQEAHNKLVDQHLNGIPGSRVLFEVNASLYDIAFQKFPGEVMLTEHFRCLPDIIQFSNRYVYQDRIVPLRDRPPKPGWQAVRALHVTDGFKSGRDVNQPEADAVADLIDKLCADPDYDGMDFGVVTMLGHAQSKIIWDALYDRLGPEVMTERRIRCGEPANFQGDERDVVFLSLVAAGTADNPTARIGAFTGDAAIRRINVAASRAREQMWVVHSVAPDRFPAGDLRSALIRHCTDPRAVETVLDRLEEQCESEFERLVVRRILHRGYRRVRVQHEVGRFCIDIVVEGADARLAVECDGDQWHGPDQWQRDRDRQTVLERAKWTFERIRGSVFFRDPDTALEPLWARLEALGITPGEDDLVPSGNVPAEANPPVVAPGTEIAFVPRAPSFSSAGAAPAMPAQSTDFPPPPPPAGVPATGGYHAPTWSPPAAPAGGTQPASAFVPPPADANTMAPPNAGPATHSSPPPPTSLAAHDVGTAPPRASRAEAPAPVLPAPSVVGNPAPFVLARYAEWEPRPLPEVSTATVEQLIDELCEIVGAEGPMYARRAYQLLVRASGGQRVGTEIRRMLNQATARAVRERRVARIHDSIAGQIEKTLYATGTDPVVVRTLGPRQLIDVPRSEIGALVQRLAIAGPSHEVHRAILDALNLSRMTPKTREYLDECLAYRWETRDGAKS